jgi:ferredoxin-thioredoxin reductase catalytic chain
MHCWIQRGGNKGGVKIVSDISTPSEQEIDIAYANYKKEADSGGYHLNPDIEFTKGLIAGLLINEHRYGYRSCPCRLASGEKPEDLDIICPCDYRDQDVVEKGACYCALYVSLAVLDGSMALQSIPERRPPRSKRIAESHSKSNFNEKQLTHPVWRCKVCGYLCARDGPPEICPICKAKKDRFERFL